MNWNSAWLFTEVMKEKTFYTKRWSVILHIYSHISHSHMMFHNHHLRSFHLIARHGIDLLERIFSLWLQWFIVFSGTCFIKCLGQGVIYIIEMKAIWRPTLWLYSIRTRQADVNVNGRSSGLNKPTAATTRTRSIQIDTDHKKLLRIQQTEPPQTKWPQAPE